MSNDLKLCIEKQKLNTNYCFPTMYTLTQTPSKSEFYYSYHLKKRAENAEALAQLMRLKAGSVAHEMRTPLAIINIINRHFEKYIPILIERCKLVSQQGTSHQPISDKVLADFPQSLKDIFEQLNAMHFIIDLFLKNINFGKPLRAINQKTSMQEVLREVLNLYPFKDHEKNLIFCHQNSEFKFYGDAILMRHVLFNLIKNALNSVHANDKGHIYIGTESVENYNLLSFKDTGKGIPQEILEHLFTPLCSNKPKGTGLGLAFCKMVMEQFGGDICCESVEGEYTLFTLKFPKLKGHGMDPKH
jgi:signal transduction histidine kinase